MCHRARSAAPAAPRAGQARRPQKMRMCPPPPPPIESGGEDAARAIAHVGMGQGRGGSLARAPPEEAEARTAWEDSAACSPIGDGIAPIASGADAAADSAGPYKICPRSVGMRDLLDQRPCPRPGCARIPTVGPGRPSASTAAVGGHLGRGAATASPVAACGTFAEWRPARAVRGAGGFAAGAAILRRDLHCRQRVQAHRGCGGRH